MGILKFFFFLNFFIKNIKKYKIVNGKKIKDQRDFFLISQNFGFMILI
jgi:hypothetical protein